MSKSNTPPNLLLRFFRWYCHPEYLEDLEGDLLERFEETVEQKSPSLAKWNFMKDVLGLFRPGIIRPIFETQKNNQYSMLKVNFKIGFRNLMKRKEYTIINALGLSIGITSSLLILLFIVNEFSYDKSFEHSDRIYKMVQQVSGPNHTELRTVVPYSLVNIMTEDYPEVEIGTAVSGPYDSQVVTVKDANDKEVNFLENAVLIADSNFFSVFSFKMLKGNVKTSLNKPNSVVLTERTAKRYFGDRDPLGQFIAPSGKQSIVTGVCADPPANSHIQFHYIVSSSSVGWFNQQEFNLRSAYCYFKLRTGSDVASLASKLPQLVENYVFKEITKARNISKRAYKEAGNDITYLLKPLASIHLSPENLGGFKEGGNITTVRILFVVAILILIIACINFTNLATARATERVREVGVRKVMGSFKHQLMAQFLTEAFILSLLSMILGVLLTIIVLPYFNMLTGSELILNFDLKTVGSLSLLTIVISLLAGAYPAFMLSSFNPVTALKGSSISHAKGGWLKSGLVSFQFWITLVLITSTLIIHKQVNHLRDKDLGFDKDQLMVIEGIAHKETPLYLPFLKEIGNLPSIQGAAGSLWVQGFGGTWTDNYRPEGTSEDYNFKRVMIGDEFAEVVNFELKSGELFSESSNDSLSVLLNESAVKAMNLQEPIGQKILMKTEVNGEMQEVGFTIKGVVKNFHYQTLYSPIEPLVIQSNENIYGRMRFIVAKVKAGSGHKTIAHIEDLWNQLIPDRPFNFRFLDDTLAAKYKSEQRTATVLSIFSGLTIFIACIGLFALSSYTISLRIKEIGIRKVLGANAVNIVLLLSKDYVKMAIFSFLLAIPFALYVGTTWLEDFAYRIEITPDIFFLSGIFILLIIWVTITIQTVRAASINPVDTLKNE